MFRGAFFFVLSCFWIHPVPNCILGVTSTSCPSHRITRNLLLHQPSRFQSLIPFFSTHTKKKLKVAHEFRIIRCGVRVWISMMLDFLHLVIFHSDADETEQLFHQLRSFVYDIHGIPKQTAGGRSTVAKWNKNGSNNDKKRRTSRPQIHKNVVCDVSIASFFNISQPADPRPPTVSKQTLFF